MLFARNLLLENKTKEEDTELLSKFFSKMWGTAYVTTNNKQYQILQFNLGEPVENQEYSVYELDTENSYERINFEKLCSILVTG